MSNQSVTKGVFEKIQRLVPGFKSYAAKEDLRHNDLMLRQKMEDSLKTLGRRLDSLGRKFLEQSEFEKVSTLSRLKDSTMLLEDEIKFAERGYSAIFENSEVDEKFLERIIVHDEALLDLSLKIETRTGEQHWIRESSLESVIEDVENIHLECRQILQVRSRLIRGLS